MSAILRPQTFACLSFIAIAFTAYADPPALLCESFATQAQIIEKNDFAIHRDLLDYKNRFGRAFYQHLFSLGPQGHWIDMGAGDAQAMTEYLLRPSRLPLADHAKVTAIAVRKPRRMERERAALRTGKFRYLSGRYVEEIPIEEIGRADVITDLFGPISYGQDPSVVLNIYLKILNVGGKIYFYDGDHTTISDGADKVKFRKWLSTLADAGIQVEPFEQDGWESTIITKLSEDAKIPPLAIESFEVERPPRREYRRATDKHGESSGS